MVITDRDHSLPSRCVGLTRSQRRNAFVRIGELLHGSSGNYGPGTPILRVSCIERESRKLRCRFASAIRSYIAMINGSRTGSVDFSVFLDASWRGVWARRASDAFQDSSSNSSARNFMQLSDISVVFSAVCLSHRVARVSCEVYRARMDWRSCGGVLAVDKTQHAIFNAQHSDGFETGNRLPLRSTILADSQ